MSYKKKYSEIYKTTNKITGDFYIGKNSSDRIDYIGSGVRLKDEIKKYGKNNFNYEVIIRISNDIENSHHILSFLEHLIIKKHINNSKCLNLNLGSKKAILEYLRKQQIYIQPCFNDILKELNI